MPGGSRLVTAVDQVWATDITSIPLEKGFLDLMAIVDHFSRNVVSWKAEISLASFPWRYCHVRPHSSLGGRTPHEVYTEAKPFLPSGVNDIRGQNCPTKGTHIRPCPWAES